MLVTKDDATFKLGIEMLSNVNLNEDNVFKISLLMNYCYTNTNRFSAMSNYNNNKNFAHLFISIRIFGRNIF